MPKVYVIVQGCGDYSDREEEPLLAFLDKEQAQAMMTKLDYIAKLVGRPGYGSYASTSSFEEKQKAYTEARAKWQQNLLQAYAEVGITLDDNTTHVPYDWALYEVELVSASGG